jgi:hypothetical protein
MANITPPRFLSTDNAAPGVYCFAITPSDTVNYTQGVARAIYVGSGGDVVIVNSDGTTCTWVGVPTGSIIPCASIRVNAASTGASSLVGIL